MKEAKRILIVGDVMLDIYIKGEAKRLSPEAPCVVLSGCSSPTSKLGGASNVAYQLSENNVVSLCGRIGDDHWGNEILRIAQKEHISVANLIIDSSKTTTKTRYISNSNHQLLRVDEDTINGIPEETICKIIEEIIAGSYDAVVLSDYGKGVLTDSLCKSVIDSCNEAGIPSIIDIKHSPYNKFRNATLIKGNEKELRELGIFLGIEGTDTFNLLKSISLFLDCRYAVVTLGKNGIAGYSKNDGFIEIPATDIPIHDVTGAGDVVTAFITVLLANQISFEEALRLANNAAQHKVSQFGTSRVSFDRICSPCPKLINDVSDILKNRLDKKIVFTNGCFDVLHAEHVDLLLKAKNLGDILVVGLNSDSSINKLKGTNRPINSFENRAKVLSALNCVDYIVKFEEQTPYDLISKLTPDILVKGGDYTLDTIVGADIVLNNGGSVTTIPFTVSTSSTNILIQLGYE